MTAPFRPCAVVPTRNHHTRLAQVVLALRGQGLPVIVVDDGSADPTRSVAARLHDPANGVRVERRDGEPGKGAAVSDGLRIAAEEGFTHVFQLDADGQHDVGTLPAMLELARRYPRALIAGYPILEGAPRSRAIGRWITTVWTWIETWSFQIADAMCGFRVYPLAPVVALMERRELGRGMDFDIDVLVRLFWSGVAVVNVPVRVRYPEGNTSNFRMLRDNWRISCLHTRLVGEMLLHLPAILRRRPQPIDAPVHWSALSERGTHLGLRFAAAACRLLGRRGALWILSPVVLFFYLTRAQQRLASREFLARAFASNGAPSRAGWRDGIRHFRSFAASAIDTFAAWTGALPFAELQGEDDAGPRRLMDDPSGALLIVSHVGNPHVARALIEPRARARITSLVYTQHAEQFNKVLGRFNPAAVSDFIQVTEIGPEGAMLLKERVERGQWIAIAGDRTPVTGDRHVVDVPFLGRDAPFATGPIVLASLLGCPVYLLFCIAKGRRYHLFVERLADRVELTRAGRQDQIRGWVAKYANALERYAVAEPYQWFNFFGFWASRNG